MSPRHRIFLAGMFMLCLSHCFNVGTARAAGLGGLRAEAGVNNDRPFKLCRGQTTGLGPGVDGERPDIAEVYQVVGRGGRIPHEAVLLLQIEAEMRNQAQRDIFRRVRQQRSDVRNRDQAMLFRRELDARRAARA